MDVPATGAESTAARAENYRNKAEEVRIIAESMRQPATRAVLLSVAQDYLNMAMMLDHLVEAGERLPELSDPKL